MTTPASCHHAGDSRGDVHWTVRTAAFLLGGFALFNVLAGCLRSGFDANIWWIDLRLLGRPAAVLVLLAGSTSMISLAVAPAAGLWRRDEARLSVAIWLLFAVLNSAWFYVLLARGAIRTAAPAPLSLIIAAAIWWILRAMRPPGKMDLTERRRPSRSGVVRGALSCAAVGTAALVIASLAQMYCFGRTDYRRDADAIVVFGAGVYRDGTVSDALADRMRMAIDLYARGYAPRLILSGGPGQGAVHETTAMREMAIRRGVPASAIILDPAGVNTRATVAGTSAILDEIGARRVLAVSHFYHLPRIKLAYQRRGRQVYTVPAAESYTLTAMPYYIAREVAAMWAYYLRPWAYPAA